MKIKVVYFSQVRSAAGIAEEQIDVDTGCTLFELAKIVCTLHGSNLENLLFDHQGTMRLSIMYSVNNEQRFVNDTAPLAANDEVLIIAPMSGG